MDLTYNDDQQEIQRTARDLLARRSGFDAVRRVADSGAYDDGLWGELVDLGWPGIAVGEEHGGLGLGVVELAILVEELGYAVASSPLPASAAATLAIAVAGSEDQRGRWLPALAAGEVTAALGMARDGVADLLPDADRASVIVLVDGDDAVLVERSSAKVEPRATIDPVGAYARVVAEGGEPLPGDVARALAQAEVLLAAQLTGICQRALDVTVAFVKERRQFGTPVGAFQAISHKCAEMLLETERVRSATLFAAWAADADPTRLPYAASVAKAAAVDAGTFVTSSAIQAHGGVGFTWEEDVHWLFKRARLLAAQLTGPGRHRERIARLAARSEALSL